MDITELLSVLSRRPCVALIVNKEPDLRLLESDSLIALVAVWPQLSQKVFQEFVAYLLLEAQKLIFAFYQRVLFHCIIYWKTDLLAKLKYSQRCGEFWNNMILWNSKECTLMQWRLPIITVYRSWISVKFVVTGYWEPIETVCCFYSISKEFLSI